MIEQEKILHLNEVQKRKVCKLIKLECANYFEGNCDLLDRGVEVPCPQMISYSVLCRYFLSSVLPGDNALYAELLEPDKVKKCVRCGTCPEAEGKCRKIKHKKFFYNAAYRALF